MGRRRRTHAHHNPIGIGFALKTFHAYIIGALSIYTQFYVLSYIETGDSLQSLGNAFGDLFVLLTPAGGTGIQSFVFYTFITLIIGYILLVVAWDSIKYTIDPDNKPVE